MILEEVNRCGGNAVACHAQMYIMGSLLRHGSEAQKQQYLPGIANGTLRLQAFGVSEPTTGSDTTQMKTMAVRQSDSYVVSGQKIWEYPPWISRHSPPPGPQPRAFTYAFGFGIVSFHSYTFPA